MTRPLTCAGVLELTDDGSLKIQAGFTVSLADYGIRDRSSW